MSEPALNVTRAPEPASGGQSVAAAHDRRTEQLSNERTHLAYVRTAISLISLGITVNRFSLYLKQHDALPSRPGRSDLLGGTASAGLGMVIYALVLMLLALHRYRAVDRAIEHGTDHSDHGLVMLVTLSVILAGAGGILWMFPR
jgi:putative membrane protein